uniref:Variant surface glycoprotein 732 n=1 Tax=Trypanosoma brucei TaxID=5691 RepID=M4TAG0_9TRYP|nr:variant surface glycoprotein 732 [Trypanosoma brucei]
MDHRPSGEVLTLTIVVTLAICRPQVAQAIPDEANAAAFAAACALLQIQEAGAPADLQPPDPTTAISELEAINMTLSDERWQSKFIKGGGEEVKWEDDENKEKTTRPEWKNKWDAWVKARQAIKDGTTEPAKTIKTSALAKLTGFAKTLAQKRVNNIIEQAKKLAASAKGDDNAWKETAKEKVDEQMLQAVYGDASGKQTFTSGKPEIPEAKTVGACNSDGTVNGKQPLAYVLLCLAAEAGAGSDRIKPIAKAVTAVNWNGISTGLQTQYTTVKGLCTQKANVAVTPEAIRQSLNAMQSQIRMINNRGYLGYYEQTGCNGVSNNGVCVKYNTKITNLVNDFGKLTYVSSMEAAANLLERRRETAKRQQAIADHIAALLHGAYNLADEVQTIADVAAIPAGNPPAKPKLSDAELGARTTECEGITKSTDCDAKTYCSYETETDGTKKCTYNATKAAANGVHATQTQAVGGTEATTDKCKGKEQKDCKDGCKWENNA